MKNSLKISILFLFAFFLAAVLTTSANQAKAATIPCAAPDQNLSCGYTSSYNMGDAQCSLSGPDLYNGNRILGGQICGLSNALDAAGYGNPGTGVGPASPLPGSTPPGWTYAKTPFNFGRTSIPSGEFSDDPYYNIEFYGGTAYLSDGADDRAYLAVGSNTYTTSGCNGQVTDVYFSGCPDQNHTGNSVITANPGDPITLWIENILRPNSGNGRWGAGDGSVTLGEVTRCYTASYINYLNSFGANYQNVVDYHPGPTPGTCVPEPCTIGNFNADQTSLPSTNSGTTLRFSLNATNSWDITTQSGSGPQPPTSGLSNSGSVDTGTLPAGSINTYRLTCGSSFQDVTVTVSGALKPVCSPSGNQNVTVNQPVTFFASSGAAPYSWNVPGANPPSGSGPSFNTQFPAVGNYGIGLTDSAGKAPDPANSCSVTVSSNATCQILANPQAGAATLSGTVNWSTAGFATPPTCSASGSWSGTLGSSGSVPYSFASAGSYPYNLTCQGGSQIASCTTTVTVSQGGSPGCQSNCGSQGGGNFHNVCGVSGQNAGLCMIASGAGTDECGSGNPCGGSSGGFGISYAIGLTPKVQAVPLNSSYNIIVEPDFYSSFGSDGWLTGSIIDNNGAPDGGTSGGAIYSGYSSHGAAYGQLPPNGGGEFSISVNGSNNSADGWPVDLASYSGNTGNVRGDFETKQTLNDTASNFAYMRVGPSCAYSSPGTNQLVGCLNYGYPGRDNVSGYQNFWGPGETLWGNAPLGAVAVGNADNFTALNLTWTGYESYFGAFPDEAATVSNLFDVAPWQGNFNFSGGTYTFTFVLNSFRYANSPVTIIKSAADAAIVIDGTWLGTGGGRGGIFGGGNYATCTAGSGNNCTEWTFTEDVTLGQGQHLIQFYFGTQHSQASNYLRLSWSRQTPANDAICTAFNAPPSVQPGSQFNVTATVQNLGSNTWTNSGPNFYSFNVTPSNQTTWGGSVNNTLPVASLTTGNSANFNFTLIAPNSAGSYPLNMQMNENGVGNFGATCSASITVSAGQQPPTNVQVNAGGFNQCSKNGISWTDSAGATGYNIYRYGGSSIPNGFNPITQATKIASNYSGTHSVASPYVDDISAAGSGPFYYWVTALSASGESIPAAAASNGSGGVSPQTCGGNLSGSDKDITSINNTPTGGALACDNKTEGLPGGSSLLKSGDVVGFQLNLCNNTSNPLVGGQAASSITLTDTLTNMQKPPSGWNVQYNNGAVMAEDTGSESACPSPNPAVGKYAVCGTVPNQTITINLSNKSIAQGASAAVTLNAQIAPIGPDSTYGRFQNSANASYSTNLSGGTGSNSFSTPLILYYSGTGVPTRNETP